METKVLQVFYGKDCLPYKDKERSVHFPIIGAAIQGASNTTQIRFYFDELVEEEDETTSWVVVSKLPNGKIGSEIIETELDSELNEHYALFSLKNFYTQAKGDLFLSLQGYQGGVQVETDPDTGISQIIGTPTIQATGSIKLAINYAIQLVGSGETANINFQKILADLGTKLGIRAYTERVTELPTTGQTNVFYAIYDDANNPNKLNIYVWNGTTQSYVWVGDNTLYLGDYYTKQEGDQFENGINNRVASVENELSSVAQGSPKGVYATLSDLETAYPTGTTGIYIVSADGHWYYWNGSAWTDGGTYLATGADYAFDKNSSNGIQNGIVADTFEKIVKSYSTLKQYLYKKDTYINDDTKLETSLSGYDLLRVPVKEEDKIIKLEWDTVEPFYGTIATRHIFHYEDSNGVLSGVSWGSTGNPNYGFKGTEGNGFIINNDVTDISYIYLSVKNDRYDKGNIYIGNEEKIQLNQKEQKTFTVVEYGNEKDFIKTMWYIKSNNSADILGSGYECVWFRMKSGDKIVLEGSIDVLSYYGVIKNQDGTLVSLGTNMEYTATSTVIVGIFLQNGASRKFTYYPVDSAKIMAENVVGLEEKIQEVIIGTEDSHYIGLSGVAFGTSLTYRSQTTGGYLTKLAELSGITFDNQGIGSSTILGNMLTAIKNYTGYSGKRVALLEGFVNDWYQEKTLGTYTDTTEDTVCGCVRSAINYMYSQNANLTVFLILDHYGRNSGGVDCSSIEIKNGKTQYEFYEEIAKVAESMGVVVIKQYAMSEISERTPQYLLDNIHMNALGAIRSAYSIWSIMKQFYPNNI